MKTGHIHAAAIICILYLVHSTAGAAVVSCGPGAGWVSSCSAGIATYNITMNFGLDTSLNSFADIDVSFTGELVVQTGDPYASDPVNAPGYLDRIDTEILSMYLAGATSDVDGWVFRMGSNQSVAPTYGYIQEQADPTLALSRFDSVFEIDSVPYGTLTHNQIATVFFEVLIDALPETGALYNHTGAPFGTTIRLYDTGGNEVLRLTDLIDTDFVTIGRPHFIVDSAVVPLPAAAWLFGSGMLGLIALAHRRGHG